jgi:hypothetical protein
MYMLHTCATYQQKLTFTSFCQSLSKRLLLSKVSTNGQNNEKGTSTGAAYA